jgi:hypothetical protein
LLFDLAIESYLLLNLSDSWRVVHSTSYNRGLYLRTG